MARKWQFRDLAAEIRKLSISDMGVSDGLAWVKCADGPKFHGLLSDVHQRHLCQCLQGSIPVINEDCFYVVREFVERYVVPRSIPGETVSNPSPYMPLRDPLNDFDFPMDRRREIARIFKPSPGEVFVDVGAYLGFGTMRVAEHVGPTGKVVAFESDITNLEILDRNLKENGFENVIVVPKAVGDHVGTTKFFRDRGTNNSLRNDVLGGLGINDTKEVTVDMTTVDAALKTLSIGSIDLANLTVNGGEIEAIVGMADALASSPGLRITIAGWYKRGDGRRVCEVVESQLRELGMEMVIGRLGRVLAWKKGVGESKTDQKSSTTVS